ncbi:MAG TPA: NADH-quinone oxidoreductase subunit L [Syntrophaceae bacterium]|nr:NADH-quinone oxidoreductase subunit L [Syntrophaceae bacterium]
MSELMSLLLALLFFVPILSSVPIAFAWVYRREEPWVKKLPILSVIGLFISLVIALYIKFYVPDGPHVINWLPDLNINFVFIFDYLSKNMGVLTALIAFLIGVYGLEYMKDDYRLGWYWFFFNLFTASMLLVVYSDNLLMLLIGWEGLGLASWGLIGHWFRDDDDISFVGMKDRKILGLSLHWSPSFGGWRAISTIRVGDMPMFFAIAAIFALTSALGTPNLNISEIPWQELFKYIGSAGTIILLIALMIGPFTKSAQLPFSEWLMTAMTGPTTVSALLHSATMVAAGTYIFMRLSWYIKPWDMHAAPGLETVYLVVLFLGLISALYGALVAVGCRERKVLLAASTMSSLGLMFGAAAASFWVGEIGVSVAFWYLMVHAFAKATLFLVAGHLIHVTHNRFCVGDKEVAKKLKVTYYVTIFATITLAGIPPLTAFWVKSGMDEVMHTLIEEGMLAPLVLLLITSVIYAAFLAKFLSLNFIKGEKAHLSLHGGKIMATAYTVMVSMLIVLLMYVILSHGHVESELIHMGLERNSMIVGLVVIVSYSFAIFKPSIKALYSVGTFLGDRMYMAFLNDFIVPKIGWAIAIVVDYGNRSIDYSCHKAIPSLFEVSSHNIRSIQSGYLKRYMKIVLGLVMVILVAISIIGM